MATGNLESYVRIDEKLLEAEKPVDREKTCPLLLRVFCNVGRHNNINDYNRGSVPSNELQIYTWMDATLRELTSLVKEVNAEARQKGTQFSFVVVSPDLRMHRYVFREIGVTISGQKGNEDNKTLGQARFVIGDYLDVCITPPRNQHFPMMRRGPMRMLHDF
ncbi:unnamed protein product [Bemisia tabaci]|uniref:Histone deacetylase complex subunit SAP18 n=1 Tax=Bemisia tabaci TaxID=7038 RepID=A0A9P0CDG8_BEMTA|nr:PREDICTED: histone deacetylase complex subunit SAP18 [Bemisia tabaci]CAH0775395.1 unnamed protein product [Bemisia tabaci]